MLNDFRIPNYMQREFDHRKTQQTIKQIGKIVAAYLMGP